MIVMRYMGYALISCAKLLLGFEVVRYLDTSSVRLVTVQQAWQAYSIDGLGKVSHSVQQGHFPGLWDDVIVSFIQLPLLGVMVSISVFLIFISRHAHLNG